MNDKQYYELRRELKKIETMVMDMHDSVIKDKKMCPICKNRVRLYLPFGVNLRSNAQCPVCRSLERHRALWLVMEKSGCLLRKEENTTKILHFAPESFFVNYFSLENNVDYWPVDIDPNFPGIRKVVNITNIPFEDNSVDIIIVNHVLEHIPDDKKALSEIYRVLAKEGVAFVSVPLETSYEKTFENSDYNTPELRAKFFGQHDHVRIYGRDFVLRLEESGFSVKTIDIGEVYSEEEMVKYGLFNGGYIFLCSK